MQVSLLGPMLIDGRPAELARRDRTVLAVLGMRHGMTCDPDDLAEALWPQGRPATWAKVIQGVVVRLRRLLGHGAIELTDAGYRLVVADDAVDVATYEYLIERGRGFMAVGEPARALVAFEDALALWRGTPLQEIEDWPPGQAASIRLQDLHQGLEEERVFAALESGRAHACIPDAQRLVQTAPFRERRWELLAMALYASGRQADALATVRRAGDVLAEQLGLDPGRALVDLERAILSQDPKLPRESRAPVASGVCPYQGLNAFQPHDVDLFVGRDDDLQACLSRLTEHPLLVLVGASGSGKSSLARAGIVPALRHQGFRPVVVTPGTRPLETVQPPPVVATNTPNRTSVLVVDQLEELRTTDADTCRTVLDSIADWSDVGLVVVTIRSDYLDLLASSPRLAELANRGIFIVTPPTGDSLRRIIEEPARRVGLHLEAGLVDLLLRDVEREPGALPLLSHALRETWVHREGDVLTVGGYRRTGGISGAVALTADSVYNNLNEDGQRAVRALMMRLVTPSLEGAPVSSPLAVEGENWSHSYQDVLDQLVASRLVTIGDGVVALAHESLAVSWPRLRVWLDSDVEGQRILEHLQVTARGWALSGRPDAELYTGARHEAALEWQHRSQPVLTRDEEAFLAASMDRDQGERRIQAAALATQRQANRRLRLLVATFAALIVVALVASTLAVIARNNAEQAAAEVLAVRLGDLANREPRADTALLAARQANVLADLPQTRVDLLRTLDSQAALKGMAELGWEGFIGAQPLASPNTDRILALQQDGVQLLDTQTAQRLPDGRPLVAGDIDDALYAVGFVADGQRVLATRRTQDGEAPGCEIGTFSAESGLPIGQFEPVPGSRCDDFWTMDRMRITSDGSRLVSMSGSQTRIWTRTASAWVGPKVDTVAALVEGLPVPRTVTTSSDATRALVVVEVANTAPWYRRLVVPVLLDLGEGRVLGDVVVDESVQSAALSPDGQEMAVSHVGGAVELIPIGVRGAVPALSRTYPGSDPAVDLRFSATSDALLLGRGSGRVDVIARRDLSLMSSWEAHGAEIALVGWGKNDASAISMDQSGLAVRHTLGVRGPLGSRRAVVRPQAVASGPKGSPLVIGEEGGVVSVYDQTTLYAIGQLNLADSVEGVVGAQSGGVSSASSGGERFPGSATFESVRSRVTALAVTPDGSAVIAGDRTGRLVMWGWPSREVLWSRSDVPAAFLQLSPDGRYLVTAEFTANPDDPAPDGYPQSSRVRLFDISTGDVLADIPTEAKKPRAVTISPDSKTAVVGFFDPGALVIDLPSGQVNDTLDLSTSSLAFTPDGSHLAVIGFDGQGVWLSTRDWAVESSWPTLTNTGYTHVAFSADGQLMFISTVAGVTVWDSHTLSRLATGVMMASDGSNDAVFLAAVPNSQDLVVASNDELAVMDLNVEHWREQACRLAGRVLTTDEWERLLPSHAYAPACNAG